MTFLHGRGGVAVNVDLDMLQREEVRIRFRQRLMALPGGVAYLLHVARLYDFGERLLGPDSVGLPDGLRTAMFRSEREKR